MSLAIADLDRMIDAIRARVGIAPGPMFEMSPRMVWRLHHMARLADLYRVYPAPRYKIRKCHMRKLKARWHEGRRRIRKIEQTVMAAEESGER